MAWAEMLGVGGASVPVLLLLWYALRRVNAVVEMFLRAHLETHTEREERATMVAVAAALPDGGAAARFQAGQPAWVFYKHPGQAEHLVLDAGEAA